MQIQQERSLQMITVFFLRCCYQQRAEMISNEECYLRMMHEIQTSYAVLFHEFSISLQQLLTTKTLMND